MVKLLAFKLLVGLVFLEKVRVSFICCLSRISNSKLDPIHNPRLRQCPQNLRDYDLRRCPHRTPNDDHLHPDSPLCFFLPLCLLYKAVSDPVYDPHYGITAVPRR